MAKTRRLILENLSSVDIILEILDARIPYSSKNPEIDRMIDIKPHIIILNKSSLADSHATSVWISYYRKALQNEISVIAADCITGEGFSSIASEIRRVLSDKIEHLKQKGVERPLRAMVVGIPNVGKSTIINKMTGAKKAAAENRPGVTLTKQWVRTKDGFDLLDMPGVLWPKFEDKTVGENLAATGAIKDTLIFSDEIALTLIGKLKKAYPELLNKRYKITDEEFAGSEDNYTLFCLIAKKRGLLISGGEPDTDRCAAMLLDEFRSGKIGRITLEFP